MKKKIVISIGVVILVFGLIGVWNTSQKQTAQDITESLSVQPTVTKISQDQFSYKGVTGKDALTLLKEKTSAEQSSSGLVVSINGRVTDSSKREYWAFYVNGKMAEVGPADYKTKDGDKVEWKIEKY